MKAQALLRSYESSPVALEDLLRQLMMQSIDIDSSDFDWIPADEEKIENELQEKLEGITAKKMVELMENAIQEIESIDNDSKLNAFSGLLNDIIDTENRSQRVCVLTRNASTLFYLTAEIESRGLDCEEIHSGLPFELLSQSIHSFASSGKILVAIDTIIAKGFTIPEVTDLILYEIPKHKFELTQILGRFDRIDRSGQLNIYVFVQHNLEDRSISEGRKILRETLDYDTDATPI